MYARRSLTVEYPKPKVLFRTCSPIFRNDSLLRDLIVGVGEWFPFHLEVMLKCALFIMVLANS